MLKIYGSMLCPDCVKCCQELKEADIPFEYSDFAESLQSLKAFLKLRDENDLFQDVRSAGKIGIPCIVRENGTITLDWEEFLK